MSRRRILVIEDNRDAAETLQALLKLLGLDVYIAHTGDEGVRAALEFQPDAIVCDIGLPGMDGYAVARALRGDPRMANVRMIALTGYGGEENLRDALSAGFDSHLIKPADANELVARLG